MENFEKKLDLGQNIGSEMLFTLRYTLGIIEKLNKEENESKFTEFGARKPVKSIGFVVIFKKFQKISCVKKSMILNFIWHPSQKFLNEKTPDSCVSDPSWTILKI